MEGSTIANKYKLLEKIGEGSFGFIFKGINLRTSEHVAIKMESISSSSKLLKNESKIYQYLNDIDGIPKVRWFGTDSINNYMVLDLLGESLESLKQRKTVFSLKLVLQIGNQILTLLKSLHKHGFIHRDIKPDNFLLGLGNKNNQIHLIDFGFCKPYLVNGTHILNKPTSSLVGTPNFASVYAHDLNELSRRDDLISLGYMLLYFLNGSLEWQVERNPDKIKSMKWNLGTDSVILKYLQAVTNLEFKEEPNYELLFDFFKIIA
jgi:serine/threonine protein kinase